MHVNLRNVFMFLQHFLVVQVQGFDHSSEARPEIVHNVIGAHVSDLTTWNPVTFP